MHSFGTTTLKELADRNVGIAACSSSEVVNKTFEPDPIPYVRSKGIYRKEINFFENEPSKFIGKPKNNFKKR